jgi:hypothetical protein
LARERKKTDKGWVDYFQHKDDMRGAGRKMAEEFMKRRDKTTKKSREKGDRV